MSRFWEGDANASSPVYVTRKDADGETGTLYLAIWMQLAVLLIAWANAFGWGLYSLVHLVGNLIEALF